MTVKQLEEGLAIFKRYLKDPNGEHLGGADHDVIYFFSDHDFREPLSDEDRAKLEDLNYHREEDSEGWAHYA